MLPWVLTGVDGAKTLQSCLSRHLLDTWGLSKAQLESCQASMTPMYLSVMERKKEWAELDNHGMSQVTIRRICYLYFSTYETVVYVRGGALAQSLFGNRTDSATCDVSVLSDEDGAWYGRVRQQTV